jgi:hypothetical protein
VTRAEPTALVLRQRVIDAGAEYRRGELSRGEVYEACDAYIAAIVA